MVQKNEWKTLFPIVEKNEPNFLFIAKMKIIDFERKKYNFKKRFLNVKNMDYANYLIEKLLIQFVLYLSTIVS